MLGEAWMTTYTPITITQSFKATGIHPLNPNIIDPVRLAPSLPTQKMELPKPFMPSTTGPPTAITIDNEIIILQERIKELKLENDRLQNPGTTSLATILQYPLQRQEASTEKPDGAKKRKGI